MRLYLTILTMVIIPVLIAATASALTKKSDEDKGLEIFVIIASIYFLIEILIEAN